MDTAYEYNNLLDRDLNKCSGKKRMLMQLFLITCQGKDSNNKNYLTWFNIFKYGMIR